MTLAEAQAAGAKTLVIGVANRGGRFSDAWREVLTEALGMGYDLASGLHTLLRDQPELVRAAMGSGRELHDVRVPGIDYPIADGRKRTGKRVLAIGTDCSVGKMYTALAMDREMAARGLKSTFRATGQTGILITGGGVPLDAVIADFMAGAVEWLTPDNASDHWDHIEGQGSLFHPSFSGVTMALIHGGRPDALILAHEPTRTHMRGLPDYGLPSLEALRDTALPLARVVNPACELAGVSVNTMALGEKGRRGLLRGNRGAPRAAGGRSIPPRRRSSGGRGAGALESVREQGEEPCRSASRGSISPSRRSSGSRAARRRKRRC